MPSCSIRWCGKSSKKANFKNEGITFHRYPKNPTLKEHWISATGRNNWYPSSIHSTICSRHFTEDCFFKMKRNRRRLLSTAIPTLYLPILTHSSGAQLGSSGTEHQFVSGTEVSSLNNVSEIDDRADKNRLSRRILELTAKIANKNRLLRNLRQKTKYLKEKIASSNTKKGCIPKKKYCKELRTEPHETSAASTSTEEEDNDEDEIIDDEELGDCSEDHIPDKKWSKQRHIGVKCTFCTAEIVGYRYKCVQCVLVDLCYACEAGGRHADHCLIRIPNPAIYTYLVNHIESLRRFLAKKVSKLNQTPQRSLILEQTMSSNEKVEIVTFTVHELDPGSRRIKIEIEEPPLETSLSKLPSTPQPSSTLPKKQMSKKNFANQVTTPGTVVQESDPLSTRIKIERKEETYLEAQIMALDNLPITNRAKSYTVTEKLNRFHDPNPSVHKMSIPEEPASTSTKVKNTKRKEVNTNYLLDSDAKNTKKIKIEKEIKIEVIDDDPDINPNFQTYGTHRKKGI